MKLYSVRLGVDRAAKDTRIRLTLKVPSTDRLSAAIQAERIGDSMVREPGVEYTHAMSVRELPGPKPVRHMAVAAAA
jgi:hypothetical protein